MPAAAAISQHGSNIAAQQQHDDVSGFELQSKHDLGAQH